MIVVGTIIETPVRRRGTKQMNGFTEHQASGASEAKGRRDVIFTWEQAQRMMPLVRQIVDDIITAQEQLDSFCKEKADLDRRRHSLDWPQRSRRYQLGEEIDLVRVHLRENCTELEDLGVTLIDIALGQIGFQTVVNNRRAYFSWRPGDENVDHWHFARNTIRRTVPDSWKEGEAPQQSTRPKAHEES